MTTPSNKKLKTYSVKQEIDQQPVETPFIIDACFWLLRATINKSVEDRKKKNWIKYLAKANISSLSKKERISFNNQLAKIDRCLQQQQLPSFMCIKECKAIKQMGVYATKTIKKGSVIGLYTGDVISRKGFKENQDQSYLFDINTHYMVDGKNRGNYTRYINHASELESNATPLVARLNALDEIPQILIIASKTIQASEQILFDYGSNYFKYLNIKPVVLTSKM